MYNYCYRYVSLCAISLFFFFTRAIRLDNAFSSFDILFVLVLRAIGPLAKYNYRLSYAQDSSSYFNFAILTTGRTLPFLKIL